MVPDIRDLPELTDETVHIWGVYVPDSAPRLEALSRVLSIPEREKAGRFVRAADRHSSIAARGTLRILLSGYAGIPAPDIRFTYSAGGKPYLAGNPVKFNVSHSADWVVIAIGKEREVGVDIERIRREMDVQAIASRSFLPEELARMGESDDRHTAFFRCWARKEAYVKACGSTLFSELRRTAVPMGNGEEQDGWFFYDLDAGSKYAAAVVTDRPVEGMPCYDFGGLKWPS